MKSMTYLGGNAGKTAKSVIWEQNISKNPPQFPRLPQSFARVKQTRSRKFQYNEKKFYKMQLKNEKGRLCQEDLF